jgi:hypothetical protein
MHITALHITPLHCILVQVEPKCGGEGGGEPQVLTWLELHQKHSVHSGIPHIVTLFFAVPVLKTGEEQKSDVVN